MNQPLAETCLRYLDGDLTAQELQDFNQLLAESPEAADLLAQLALDEQQYRTTPAKSEDFANELLKLEAAAKAFSPATDPSPSTKSILSDPSFWTYAAGQALRTKPAIWAAVAAVVLLTATLIVVFITGPSNTPQSPNLANTPNEQNTNEPGRTGPAPTDSASTNPIVATLTADRNATWDRQPGQNLHAGERFTLTQGFAEIMTNRGTIVLLQAPASIELLDNENAIHLHTGKLVGICEAEPSKGFLVRTRHSEITDLGTRFGVDASTPGVTRVQVFEGEVAAMSASAAAGVPPTRLTAGSSSQLKSANGLVEPIAYNDDLFASLLGRVAEMVDGYSLLGDIERVNRLPESGFGIDQSESDQAQLYRIATGVTTDEAVRLHLGKPGIFVSPPADKHRAIWSVLPAGTRFDLYLVHFDPPGNKETLVKQSRVDFEITFNRPIYGVFANTPFPAETSVNLDRYQNDLLDAEGPGLMTYGDNDRLVLSRNRRVLNGTLNAMICDRFWVLVTHEPGDKMN